MADTDSAYVTSLIREAPLCGPCIARKTALPRPRVVEVLNALRERVPLVSGTGRCESCFEDTIVHRVP